ncbi:histidine kinase [Eisenbergiella massiliensis]|uniref:sensor histidine kinase n=1 Tax=Eisenbergiella massiliensis TaxID=1720294 RepID=UPI00046F9F16
MEKIEMKRENNFIRYLFKWLLLIFAVFAIVSICFNLITYIREKRYYSEIIEQEQRDRINYLSKNINDELTTLKITASMAVKEDIVQDLYCQYDFVNSYERNKMMEDIRKRCLEIDNLNSFVSSSTLILPGKNLKIDRDGYDIVDEDAYAFLLNGKRNDLIHMENGKAYIFEILNKNYLFDKWSENNILGIFIIELNTGLIRQELQYAKMMDADVLFMTNPDKDTIYFTTGDIAFQNLEPSENKEKILLDGEEYLFMNSKDDGDFFSLYYMQDQGFLHLIQEKMITNILLFAGIIVLTILVAFLLFYKRVFQPLEILLVDAFEQIKESNLSYRIPVTKNNVVFTRLYQNFNYMAERIDTLVSRELKQEILVNQANYKHLQAQINPHFMYNSYFLLYRMIKRGDKEGSLLVCENLGKFFKYINRDSGENKSLSDEISHARSYAIIQGYRYQGIIHVDFPELPQRYNYIVVPRLIIQPLIENVFKYVVSELEEEEEVKLKVSYEEADEELLIHVENSGRMEEKQLEEIRKKLYGAKKEEDITALMNINTRLNVFFGQERSLETDKSVLGGLKVSLHVRL